MQNARNLVTILLLFFAFGGQAQTCKPNLDFELGNFNNWEAQTGTVGASGSQNQISVITTGPEDGHHEIMRDGVDSFGGFPRVCPYGGNYSVRLGTSQSGAEAEGIVYTFTVPQADTFIITYFYAVVLQNPTHESYEQPRFNVEAIDVTDGNRPVSCSDRSYVASGNNPGFRRSPLGRDIYYHDWTAVGMRLTHLAGHVIQLRFTVADCTRGGHFGYAYVDMASSCTGLHLTAPICPGSPSATLIAPSGYSAYHWYDPGYANLVGQTQTVVLNPAPPVGTTYQVILYPFVANGCRDTATSTVMNQPFPDTPSGPSRVYYCQGQPTSPLTAVASPGHLLLWYDNAVGGVGNTQPPFPETDTVGSHTWWVAQQRAYGCEGPRRAVTVTVVDTARARFVVNQALQCQAGNSFTFTTTTPQLGGGRFNWYFGDGRRQANAGTTPVQISYPNTGIYSVVLELANAGMCSSRDTMKVVVIPSPDARVAAPDGFCLGSSLLHLADSSTTIGAAITRWEWLVAGQPYNTRDVYLPLTSSAAVPVRLTVTTQEGCRSRTLDTLMEVHGYPTAALAVDGHCDNEPLRFSDASTPAAGDPRETISGWAWYVDNTMVSTQQRPALQLSAGPHQVWMAATSNFGCSDSSAVRTVTVDPAPHISFAWSDSCVGRAIRFTAVDSLASVTRWRWHFGDAFRDGGLTEQQQYQDPGTRVVLVSGATATGCVDTVSRVVRVFENISVAGRDTIAILGEPLQFDVAGIAGTRYQWTPADGLDNPAAQNPVALWDQDIRYTLQAVDAHGCARTSSVFVRRIAGPDIYVPNAFTPNGDGRNDVLRVLPVGIRVFHYFALYDRWGRLVFRTTDPARGWDGMLGSIPAGTTTYVYVTEGTDIRGNKLTRKGSVTLVR